MLNLCDIIMINLYTNLNTFKKFKNLSKICYNYYIGLIIQ